MARLSKALGEYEAHLTARGLKQSTRDGRRYTVRKFIKVNGDLSCATVDQRHVDAYFLANTHWSNGARNNELTNLKHFFGWCRHARYMAGHYDPLFGYKYLDYQPEPKLRVPVAEWPRLFQACQDSVDRATLSTGLYLFLRASEQKALRVGWLNFNSHEVKVWREKRSRFQILYMSEEFETLMREHLTYLAAHGWAEPDHFLLPARPKAYARKGSVGFQTPSERIPTQPIAEPWDVVKGILGRAGYPTLREGEHTLRRSGARAYFDTLSANGYDRALRRVMLMLGHKTSKVTEDYIGLDVDTMELQRDLAGKAMFPELKSEIVVPLRRGM